ncbi:MAG: import inner rane translocase subunit Tim44 [Acidobacteria bacterium]|nr:import inner rane translocase subunit Tim44 [Acidobacteriota bacterium]
MKLAGMIAAALAIVCLAGADLADAKRLGGGKSIGTQRQSVAPAPATPPSTAAAPAGAASQPVMPAQPGAAAAKAATPAAAPSGMSKWMGPIAGLAAGLGLAALLSHFGLSEGFASMLLILLLVVGVVLVVRMFLARRSPARPAMQYAGVSGLSTKPGGYETQPAPPIAREARVEPVIGAAPTPSTTFARPLPAGFDAQTFVEQAKLQFGRLQAAYDRGDRKALADVMTPAMLAEVGRDLEARAGHQPTEVVALTAEVLEVKTEGRDYWASVRFTGTLREDGTVLPTPFDEIWNLTKPVDGSTGWLLAGIEQVATV